MEEKFMKKKVFQTEAIYEEIKEPMRTEQGEEIQKDYHWYFYKEEIKYGNEVRAEKETEENANKFELFYKFAK